MPVEKIRFTARCAFCGVLYSGAFVPGAACTIECQCGAVGGVTQETAAVRLDLWQRATRCRWPAGVAADRQQLEADVAFREGRFEHSDVGDPAG